MGEKFSSIGMSGTADEDTLTKSSSNVFSIKSLGVDTPELKASCVTSPKMGFGMLEKLVETTISGADVQQIDITGLDLEADKCYDIACYFLSGSASTATVYIYFNDDTANANYYRQQLLVNNATVTGARDNNPHFVSLLAGVTALATIRLMKIAGQVPTMFTMWNYGAPSAITLYTKFIQWISTANVTKISFVGGEADTFAEGTKIIIYKVLN